MMSLGILASSQRSALEPDTPVGYETISLLNSRRTTAGPNENTFFTGVSVNAGSTVILVAAIKDYGPSIYDATDQAGNTYEEIIRFRDPSTSAAAVIFASFDCLPVPTAGFISFAATYDDPANNYPLPTGVSVLDLFEFSGVDGVVETKSYFNPGTPVTPPKTDARKGDLVLSNLAGGVTTRIWTPTALDYTYPEPYRGGNLTSYNAWDVRDEDGPTAPEWSRSGSNANTSVITARFAPKSL